MEPGVVAAAVARSCRQWRSWPSRWSRPLRNQWPSSLANCRMFCLVDCHKISHDLPQTRASRTHLKDMLLPLVVLSCFFLLIEITVAATASFFVVCGSRNYFEFILRMLAALLTFQRSIHFLWPFIFSVCWACAKMKGTSSALGRWRRYTTATIVVVPGCCRRGGSHCFK